MYPTKREHKSTFKKNALFRPLGEIHRDLGAFGADFTRSFMLKSTAEEPVSGPEESHRSNYVYIYIIYIYTYV